MEVVDSSGSNIDGREEDKTLGSTASTDVQEKKSAE